MSFAGGNLGSVYTGKEGFGKAFILPEDDDALKAMGDLLKADADAKKLKAAKEKAKADKKRKMQTPPEHWRIHSETIQGMTDDLFKLGSDLMAAGIDDPMTSTDPASRQFQEYWAKLENMSNYSNQLKDQFQKDFQLINAHPEKYDEESMDKNRSFYENSSHKLKEYAEEGVVAPRLIAKEEEIDLQKYMGEMAKNLGANNADPDYGDFKDMISIGFNDPKNSGFKTAMMDQLHHINNDPVRKAALEAEAKANGVTPLEQLGIQQLGSFFKTEPIDINASIQDFLPAVAEYGTKEEDIAGVTEGTRGYYLPKERLESAAKAWLDINPKAVEQLMQNNDDLKSKDDVLKWVKDYMESQVKTKAETFTTREKDGLYGGRSKEEVEKDMDLWYQALSSDYGKEGGQENIFRYYNLAGNYAAGANLNDGTVITSFQPVQVDAKEMKALLGGDYNPDLNPGSAENYNPNILPFTVLSTETVNVQGKDNQGNKITKKKVIKKPGKKYFDFDNKGDLFPSKAKMEEIYLAALKARGYKLFSEVMEYEGTDKSPTESREKIMEQSKKKKEGKAAREKAKGGYNMSGNNSGSPADGFTN